MDTFINSFIEECRKGNLDKAKYIYSLGQTDVHYLSEFAFRVSCYNGHLETAKWIWSLGDVIQDFNEIFWVCCSNGHMETAKWLYSFGTVDIHYCHEAPFRFSCYGNYIKIAQWLYSLGGVDVNDTMDNPIAFNAVCRNQNIKLAEWLCTLCEDYKMEIIDNKINKYWITGSLEELLINKEYDKIINKLKLNPLNEESECPICYGIKNINIITKCNHIFCIQCFSEWKISCNDTCPCCRQIC